MLSDILEVTQKEPGHLPFLKPILPGRSLGFENQGVQTMGPEQLSAGPGGWAWGREDDRVSADSSRALPCSEAQH